MSRARHVTPTEQEQNDEEQRKKSKVICIPTFRFASSRQQDPSDVMFQDNNSETPATTTSRPPRTMPKSMPRRLLSSFSSSISNRDSDTRTPSNLSQRTTISGTHALLEASLKEFPPLQALPALTAENSYRRERLKRVSNTHKVPKFSDDLRKVLSMQPSMSKKEEEQKKKNGVRFTEVIIREYPIIVGDHPGGSKGAPLSIAWQCLDTVAVNLDQYETARSGHRRKHSEMHLTSKHRENILRNLGFTKADWMQGTEVANIVRNQRRQTNAFIHANERHEKMEMVTRKITNVLTFGRRNRKMEVYLKKHVASYREKQDIENNDELRIVT